MISDHIHKQLSNVLDLKFVHCKEPFQVAQTLQGLCARVLLAYQVAMGVERDLASHEQLIADAIRVAVLRRGRESCIDFGFVHRIGSSCLRLENLAAASQDREPCSACISGVQNVLAMRNAFLMAITCAMGL